MRAGFKKQSALVVPLRRGGKQEGERDHEVQHVEPHAEEAELLRDAARQQEPRADDADAVRDDHAEADADAVVRRDAHAPLLEVVQADEEAHAQRHQEVEHGPGEARREGLRVNQPVSAGVAVDGTRRDGLTHAPVGAMFARPLRAMATFVK